MYHEAMRDEQVKVLRNVRPVTSKDVVLGQYRGYRDEPGVAKESRVPTYASLRLRIDSWRWDGVPFFVRAGKGLRRTALKSECSSGSRPRWCSASRSPNAETTCASASRRTSRSPSARRKRAGEGMLGQEFELAVTEQPVQGQAGRMGDYERLLGDALAGDATLFARQDLVEAAWVIVEPLLSCATQVEEYEFGSAGPRLT